MRAAVTQECPRLALIQILSQNISLELQRFPNSSLRSNPEHRSLTPERFSFKSKAKKVFQPKSSKSKESLNLWLYCFIRKALRV